MKFDLQPYAVIRGAQRVISGVQFQKAGNVLATFGADGYCRLFDIRTNNTPLMQVKMEGPCKASWDLQGERIATVDTEGNLQITDLRNVKPLSRLHADSIFSAVQWGNKDEVLLGSSRGLYAFQEKEIKAISRTENMSVECIDFDTLSEQFAIGCTDGTVNFLE